MQNHLMVWRMVDVREMYEQRIDAARMTLSRGDQPAAERFLSEALVLGERLFGAEHASLGVVLNELSRLHIRRSNHVRAKALLERLLRIARTKGEDHADVATALAGLALAHRGLGDVATAERLFREALRIREKVLAPDHMAIVVTLEQLSETCAARVNLAEALTLLRRALPKREAALGADHVTVRAIRTRMANLEVRLTPPTARSAAAIAPVATPVLVHAATSVVQSSATHSVVANHGVASDNVVHEGRQPTLASFPADTTRGSSRKRAALYASAGLAAVALAIVALTSQRAGFGSDQRLASADADQAADSIAATATATLQLLASTAQAETRSLAARSEQPSIPAAPRRLAAMSVPIIATMNVDSLVRASTHIDRESDADRIGTVGGLRTSPFASDASAKLPVLIGPAPLPRFPDVLRAQRTEGEVVVRFRVDERGRVDGSSMQVMRSDHELFTLAVRNVLPRFRFEPARSAAPESKPRSEWVDFRAEFTSKN
ncbi:MAG: TonB family protein [Gemmatimonadaceae bacterium]